MRAKIPAPLVILLITMVAIGCGAPDTAAPPNAASAAAPPAPVLQAQPPANDTTQDQRLSSAVTTLLEQWLVRRDAEAAVQGMASRVFARQNFVPAAAFDPAAYQNQRAGLTTDSVGPVMPEAEFERGLRRALEATTGPSQRSVDTPPDGLGAIVSPFTPEIARAEHPQLWAILQPKEPRTLTVGGQPVLAYRVTQWSDISWTASPTVGYQFALAQVVETSRVNLQAVVSKLKSPREDEKSPLVVTLWSDEGQSGGDWKLLGVELPPVD